VACTPFGFEHPRILEELIHSKKKKKKKKKKEEEKFNNLCTAGFYFSCTVLLRVRLSPVRESGFLLHVYGTPLAALRHGRDEPCAKYAGQKIKQSG